MMSPKPIRKAFLLAAGLGTRLRPLTDDMPKCLVPIRGRPLCDYWFGLCEAHGIEEILMNTHHLAGRVEEYVGCLDRRIKVHLVHEDELLGSAGTVRRNAGFVDGEGAFMVIYADNLSNADLTALSRYHLSHTAPLTVAVFRTQYPSQCGIVSVDADGRVVGFEEKPEHPESNLANAGLYVADVDTISEIPCDKPVVDYGHDVLPLYTGRMYSYTLDCYHVDIGTPESYRDAQSNCPDDLV